MAVSDEAGYPLWSYDNPVLLRANITVIDIGIEAASQNYSSVAMCLT